MAVVNKTGAKSAQMNAQQLQAASKQAALELQ
eukprot:CAMPEP_0185571894 /NCGR_PEP_ID=MMETSP0434-20130131/3894_1 /TAXON_ID=626734 ORGANISM="Favella taraikaensis, Strain Fe Narragansett Bay" /NCGR_SAMPLE_ID=MMETSP0434 /ASSEMBLY_ACC=CAM_ASM_000379 /LENGTH=31 /DNA_ID= /DNA_START= /DNA_END= /DNA_ORIENTATION=